MKWPFLGFMIGASIISVAPVSGDNGSEQIRSMRFDAKSPGQARMWQEKARVKLYQLMMNGSKPEKCPANPRVINREEVADAGYVIEELELNSLPDRKVHAWIVTPGHVPEGGLPGVLALHGHSGTGEQIVRGEEIYWYGKAFAERGYVVASLDIGQHEIQHEGWSMMGERVWDALTVLDYMCDRPEVDESRVGTAGLSLGGESVMYVAALDERLKIAVSSGWLTTIENMKTGHCPCWNFPGLEEHFDFSDIFACVAPRYLITQIGRKEKAPGGFPLDIAQKAFKEIQKAYKVFNAEENCYLDVHDSGHEFIGEVPFKWFDRVLKK
ncbi:hypothetical protein GF312_16765 [Candidatus Poribacteria bacterium]|nr:hypothetical protein [Candidatus Poribacteria bacterium]